ncbi:hypothetical protein [Terrisporobacter glycolicus]|uniref:hypothetical protein n=1 Tax=Terrisporobacter glycolicus TaxID=36841 RepID=UPI003464BC12
MENQLHRLSITDSNEKFELRLDGFKINGVKEYEVKNSVDKEIVELSLKIVLEGVGGYRKAKEITAQEVRVQEQYKLFRTITTEKVEEIKKIIFGLDSTEWAYIKGSIDMYFSKKAANIKIDDLDEIDNFLKRGI